MILLLDARIKPSQNKIKFGGYPRKNLPIQSSFKKNVINK
jgi:hypothetical protein